MTYTSYPLPTIDTVNSHVGFYIVAAIGAVFVIFQIVSWVTADYAKKEEFESFTYASWTYISVCIAAALISWNTGEITVYKNTPIAAKRLDIHGESHNASRRQGKRTEYYVEHNLYVTYAVPEGIVTFKISQGQPWPNEAILYRN